MERLWDSLSDAEKNAIRALEAASPEALKQGELNPDPQTVVGCSFATCDWTGSFSQTAGGATRAMEARREHIAEMHPGPLPDASTYAGLAIPAPTLPEFLAAVKRDDAAMALDMPEPVQMWGVVQAESSMLGPAAAPQEPLALFPSEHAAWRWLLTPPGGDRGGWRGRFAVPPENHRVVPFMVAVALAER